MTTEPLKLIYPPVHPSCFADENPIGFLIRLANLNGYPSYRWLLSGEGKHTFNYPRLYNLFLTEDWTGYKRTVPELLQISLLSEKLRISSLRLRYCPLCFQEEHYWRIGWQLRLGTVCTKHQIWLHDNCPNCHSDKGFLRTRRCKCVCFEHLENADAVLAPQSVIWLQQYLEKGQINQSSIFFDNNHSSTMDERYKLIEFLLRWAQFKEDMVQPIRLSFEHVSDFQDNAIQCAELLFSDDQSAFWRYLQTMHLSNTSSVGIQQKRLVSFYRQFFTQFSAQVHKPLRDAVEKYVAMNLIRDIDKKYTYLSETAKQNQLWYSFQKTCNEYGVASSLLTRAIFDKQINVHLESSTNYTKCSVYRPSLEKILPHLKGLIPARHAAAILGVTKAQFSQLQNSGCFKFETPPSQDYCSTWQYLKPELESLIENINMGAAAPTTDCLTISQVMQHHIRGTIEMPFLQLTKAILSGQIIVRKAGSEILKLRDLSIDREQLTRWLENLCPADYLSVTQASRVFGVNEEFAYQLVNRGYLQHKVNSRNSKVILPFQLKLFNQEYVILSKLSQKSDISSARLVEILDQLEIFPVDHNDSGKLRQRLYARADLIKVKLLSGYVKNSPELSLRGDILIRSFADSQIA